MFRVLRRKSPSARVVALPEYMLQARSLAYLERILFILTRELLGEPKMPMHPG